MKTKILALVIFAAIALTTIGYSYACYNGGIQINSYDCNCGILFTKVTTKDNGIEKDVAHVCAQITHDGDTINVYITNAYPCYEAYTDFTIKNRGDSPVHIDEVTVEDCDKTAFETSITNIACRWISPSETINGQLAIHMLSGARQDWKYVFRVKIKLSGEIEHHPRTLAFWQAQFSSCLSKGEKTQIDPTTLEQYLDKITAQSQIFKFSGTQKQKFKQALDTLSTSPRSSTEAKLKAQLLTLWLNYAAGYTEGYKLNGRTAYEIIQGSENALKNRQTSRYEYWENQCEAFNNLT